VLPKRGEYSWGGGERVGGGRLWFPSPLLVLLLTKVE
jgi:hypothetical protein